MNDVPGTYHYQPASMTTQSADIHASTSSGQEDETISDRWPWRMRHHGTTPSDEARHNVSQPSSPPPNTEHDFQNPQLASHYRAYDNPPQLAMIPRSQRQDAVAYGEGPPCPPPIQARRSLVDFKALVYVGCVDHNLLCPICYCPFVNPRKLLCDHYFCEKCISKSLDTQHSYMQSCPSCRATVSRTDVTCASRIIEHMLADLKVKCPLQKDGCEAEMTRGSVQDHLDRYCAFVEVKCPMESCQFSVRRKDIDNDRCLHGAVNCKDCKHLTMEKDMENHRSQRCRFRKTYCPDCYKELLRVELEAHIEHCSEAIFSCRAKAYGCDFVGKRSILDSHATSCPLAKLTPFLEKQSKLLEEHEAALKHLQHKNSILETSFQTIQETLSPNSNLVDSPLPTTPTAAGGPFDSTAHHLLSLHESLREEVSRVSAAVSELDAKASMMVMNESLRLKDELSHANAAIGGLRHQLQWLVSARVQNEQRMAMARVQASNHGPPPAVAAGNSSQGSEASSSRQPVRANSDSTRQETKL